MKHFLIVFLICCSLLGFSQDYFKPGYGEKKHSIGFFVSPAAYTRWFAPEYSIVSDQQSSGFKGTFIFYTPSGINYQYNCNNTFKVQLGVFTTLERKKYSYLHTTSDAGISLLKDIDYNVDYVNIPLNVKFFPGHLAESSDAIGGLYIQAGVNFDFITKEHIVSTTYTSTDHHFQKPAGYVDPNYKQEESNSLKTKFNRVCPTLAVGQEIVWDRLILFFGGNLQLPNIYHKNNTLEYLTNFKFSLVNVGLSYRF